MAVNKLYGVPLSDGVLQQLRYREQLLAKDEKSVNELMIDNNQGAWVMLTSSAQIASDNTKLRVDYIKYRRDILGDITEEDANTQLAKVEADSKKYGNELAEANILSGGTLLGRIREKNGKNVLTYERRTGLAFNQNYNRFGNQSNYEQSEVFGFRPMMGITDMKVVAQGANGTLRKATVTVKAHSPEQLSILESLYFRIGFTMLLEWGNSTYLDKDGEINNTTSTISKKFNIGNNTIEELKKLIVELREKSGYNYDAMIGKVVNFKWSLGDSQTYDCTIDILTEGEVVDALKTTFETNKEDNVDKYTDKNQADTSKTTNDLLIDHLTAFKNFSTLKEFKKDKYPNGDLWVYRSHPLSFPNQENLNEDEIESQAYMYFMTLRDFCYIFNKLILEKQDTGNIKVKLNTDFKKTTFKTLPGHISNDPAVCTMPYRSGKPYEKANTRTVEYNLYGGIQDKFGTEIYKPAPVKYDGADYQPYSNKRVPNESGLAKKKLGELFKEDFDDNSPLKILLNIDYLISVQEDFIASRTENSEEEAGTVSQFFNRILGDISAALGGVNKLELLLNEDDNEWLIIDKNDFTPLSKPNPDSKTGIPLINVIGLKSTVKDLSIESKIGKNLYNQLAIAATQGGYDTSEQSLEALLKFNENVRDRYAPINIPKDKKTSPITDKWKKYKEDGPIGIAEPWHSYVVKGIYNADAFSSAKSIHRSYMAALFSYTNKKIREKKPHKFQGILPIDLSITMRGIGGLKIGEAFVINNAILPERVRDKVGFSITGIDSSIGGDNMWYTTINTNIYNLPDIEPELTDDELDDIPTNPPEQNIQPDDDTPNANRLRAKIDEAGFIEKGQELSNGGDITSEMADFGISIIDTVKAEVPGIKLRFTGGNDKYHQNLEYNSRHKSGRALDFTITPYSPSAYNKVLDIIQGYAAGQDDEIRFKDEYKRLTPAATGAHFHISWGKGTEGDKELAAAKKRADKGEIQTYTV